MVRFVKFLINSFYMNLIKKIFNILLETHSDSGCQKTVKSTPRAWRQPNAMAYMARTAAAVPAADRLCLYPVVDRPEFKRERAVAPSLFGVVGHQFSAVDQDIGADGTLYADKAQSHAHAQVYC